MPMSVKHLFLMVFLAFIKLPERSCLNDKYGNYDSLQAAKDACKKDANCFYVYDEFCDNIGPIHLCQKNVTLLKSATSKSCVYATAGNFILFRFQLLILFWADIFCININRFIT